MAPLLEVKNLSMHFPLYGGFLRKKIGAVQAVTDVSFTLEPGKTLGIVGESGCGKTTLGRTLVRLYDPSAGSIHFQGLNLAELSQKDLKVARRDIQMIFQDPFASLNPRMSVRQIIEEPLSLHRIGNPSERLARVKELVSLVGLRPEILERFPHEFSGGQRQRICIARALALNPKLIVADEPVSALDVSIQSQVINLMMELQKKLGLTYIFITHDLAVVHHIADQIAVMYLGKIVEMAPTEELFLHPVHPYTKALLSAVPVADPHRRDHSEEILLSGDIPSPMNPPTGCAFHTRCPFAQERCRRDVPQLTKRGQGKDQNVACHVF